MTWEETFWNVPRWPQRCRLGVRRGAAAAALRKEELDCDDPRGRGSNASSPVTLNRQHPKRLSTTGGSTNGACSPSQEEAPAASHGGAGGCKGFGSEILRVCSPRCFSWTLIERPTFTSTILAFLLYSLSANMFQDILTSLCMAQIN